MKPDQLVVSNLMARDPTALTPRHHIAKAAEEMRLGRIRHIPIVDAQGRLAGVVSHRDVVASGEDTARPVSQIMNADPITVGPDTPAREAAYLMLHHAIGCVPVVGVDDKLVGIITDTDFVRVAYRLLGGAELDDLEQEEHEADNI